MIKYGTSKTTNLPIHISKAERGLKCDCKCFGCGNDLVANQGKINEWYFDHYLPSNCGGGKETAMHIMAKEIIANNSQILTPNSIVEYSNVEIEKCLGFLRPDLSIESLNEKIFIEIFVTNKKENNQIALFRENKLKSFEIDLSSVSHDLSPNELKEIVLNTSENRRWIFQNDENILPKRIESVVNDNNLFSSIINCIRKNPILTTVISFLLLFLFYNLSFQKNVKLNKSK